MSCIPPIDIKDYSYDLPQEKIAQFPLASRDESRLLICRKEIHKEDKFYNITDYLPDGSRLIYNETKVIQARLEFYKESGALIEIFCLEPYAPTREVQQAFELKSGVTWKCLVGNSKKWKSGTLQQSFQLHGKPCSIQATRIEKLADHSLIEFQWNPVNLSFSEILQKNGIMPLPPYMKRDSAESDKVRYQTIYAQNEGSVAAPTAGLHFTEEVFFKLKRKNITNHQITLHVGAGTFKPVSAENIKDHEMHTEQIHVSKDTLEALICKDKQAIVAVGTTSLRTLESIYWHGVKLLTTDPDGVEMNIQQWDPYRDNYNIGIPMKQALEKVLQQLKKYKRNVLSGQTQLMIVPGYQIRMADILITNFHMPQSTLLLLVSAFYGPGWKEAYQFALDNDFRFLSYGDSCLFYRK